ncbi:unnamed protein product [Peronospora effusa]|nr:unnamed protein product [Peronospora effusa]
MRFHPTFYVGRLKAYLPADFPSNLPRSSVPARDPTFLEDDSQVDVGSQPVLAAHVGSVPQPQSQQPYDLDLSQPSREHQVGHSSIPWLQREVGAAHHSTVQARECENRRSSPEVIRRDAPPPLVDASVARRWIVDRIVDHEDHKPQAPSNDSAPKKKHVEKHYRVHWLGYSPADDTWEPSSTLSQDVPDVVEDYESRRKTVIATDAAGFFPYLASLNAREQRNHDDLPSDSETETYYEARENTDDTVDDLGYVNALGDRKDALSLAVARTTGAPKGFSHNGQSMDEYDLNMPRAHTKSSHSCRTDRDLPILLVGHSSRTWT